LLTYCNACNNYNTETEAVLDFPKGDYIFGSINGGGPTDV